MDIHYHLFVNDYATHPNDRARLFKDNICAAVDCDAVFWLEKMAQPLLEQNYTETWDHEFRYSETDKVGEEKILHVYGSTFVRHFFNAIFRLMEWNHTDYCRCETSDVRPPMKINACSLSGRLQKFAEMAIKHGGVRPKTLNVVLKTNIEGGEFLIDFLKKKHAGYHGVFNVDFKIAELNSKETADLKVLLLSGEKKDKVPTGYKLAFLLWNESFPMDDVLNPFTNETSLIREEDVNIFSEIPYRWHFRNPINFIDTVYEYVESQLLAPTFASLCQRYIRNVLNVENIEQMSSCVDTVEWCTWLRLTRVFPFTMVGSPKEMMVEQEYRIHVHHDLAQEGDFPPIAIDGHLTGNMEDRIDSTLSFKPTLIDPVSIAFKPSRHEESWPREWQTECVFVCVNENGKGDYLSDTDKRQVQVPILNHHLTTHLEATFLDAERGDDGIYRGKTHEKYCLSITAKNRYEESETPQDADDFQVVASDTSLPLKRVHGGVFLTPEHPGKYRLSITHGNGRCGTAAIEFCAFDVATALHYEIKGVPMKGHLPIEVTYDASGDAWFTCFLGDEFTFRAWLEGPSSPLWESRVVAEELEIEPWNDKEKVHRWRYSSVGERSFTLAPIDASLPCRTVTCTVLVNYSDGFKKAMLIGTMLAAFHAWFIYGLGWWTTLVYFFPLLVYGIYHYRRFPLYRKLMLGLFIWDLFMALQAVYEEFS